MRNRHILARLLVGTGVLISKNFGASAQILDPEKFVTEVYKQYVAAQHSRKTYNPPKDIYTPRLAGLFEKDRRLAKGEVGCIDMDFWVNGQDWDLTKVKVSSQEVSGHPDQKIVVAAFDNLRTPMELHFHFVEQRGKWLLDDVASVKGDPWMLSKLLSCWP